MEGSFLLLKDIDVIKVAMHVECMDIILITDRSLIFGGKIEERYIKLYTV
jgi:hypothetical protein